MGQAKNRGTREQRVAEAEQNAAWLANEQAEREQVIKLGKALASARQHEALAHAARNDQRDPPKRIAIVGGISPRMRLALSGLALAVDRVGVVTPAAQGDQQ